LHFAPTERARQNLLREGIAAERVHITGNTVIDALLHVTAMSWSPPESSSVAPALRFRADHPDAPLVLVTAHRRESFGRPMENICRALKRLASALPPPARIVYPVHMNPNVQEPVRRLLGDVENIELIRPLDYFEFAHLLKASTFVLTDSGGIQEEAPSLGKPVLVMRETTERPEAIEAGTARLVGTDPDRIFDEAMRLHTDRAAYDQMARAVNPFGDGHAGERVAEILSQAPAP
jgi:UDP-N-acetylglucosamine 2-epimerase (non-hydrolysing)